MPSFGRRGVPVDWLIVGLGNPGSQYQGTPHNIGFAVAEHLIARWELPKPKSRYRGLITDGTVRITSAPTPTASPASSPASPVSSPASPTSSPGSPAPSPGSPAPSPASPASSPASPASSPASPTPGPAANPADPPQNRPDATTRLQIAILMPQTYMNDAGRSVGPARGELHVDPDHIIVVHDEIDLPFAEIRTRLGGGLAGHNGLKSIKAALGTPDFHRVRIGVGRPPTTDPEQVAAFVLGKFRESREAVENLTESAANEVSRMLS